MCLQDYSPQPLTIWFVLARKPASIWSRSSKSNDPMDLISISWWLDLRLKRVMNWSAAIAHRNAVFWDAVLLLYRRVLVLLAPQTLMSIMNSTALWSPAANAKIIELEKSVCCFDFRRLSHRMPTDGHVVFKHCRSILDSKNVMSRISVPFWYCYQIPYTLCWSSHLLQW